MEEGDDPRNYFMINLHEKLCGQAGFKLITPGSAGICIATDKRGIHIIFFLFLHENLCSGYSLEAPQRGASNEYPQRMFSWRNKKDISIFQMKKVPYLLLCVCATDYAMEPDLE